MADHGARDHATWSASATARNVHCPGALALTRFAPEKSSIHADTGTAVHQIAEKCLRTGVEADTFVDTIEDVKGRKVPVTEEMANSAQEYVDYVMSTVSFNGDSDAGARLFIEERFSLSSLGTPFDAGGTADAVIYAPYGKALIVIDLKNGMGVVDVKDNPQLRTYGLGALLAHPELDVDTVTVTIVQPRAPHKDGRIRSETFTVAELVEWTAALLEAMQRSKQAIDEFDAAGANTVLLDDWRDKWLRPGKCTFCPVEGSCPALKRDALSVAKIWFDDMDQPQIGNAALDQSPEALARDLDMLDMLEGWISARRALAHALAESGVKLPTPDGEEYYLADKIGHRKWTDEEKAKAVIVGAGFDEDKFYAKKPITPAVADKLLGAKRKALIEPFTTRPVTGTNLVRSDKTTRPAAKSVAERFFET